MVRQNILVLLADDIIVKWCCVETKMICDELGIFKGGDEFVLK